MTNDEARKQINDALRVLLFGDAQVSVGEVFSALADGLDELIGQTADVSLINGSSYARGVAWLMEVGRDGDTEADARDLFTELGEELIDTPPAEEDGAGPACRECGSVYDDGPHGTPQEVADGVEGGALHVFVPVGK
jgi:hypothetical protein